MFGVGAVIMLPLLYGAMGFIACLVMVRLYDRMADLLGRLVAGRSGTA